MIHTIRSHIKPAVKDRWMAGLTIVNVIVAVMVIIAIIIGIQPNETQVITRYTSYGITNFYRDHWYVLFNYVALEILVVAAHTLFAVKLLAQHRRQLALALLWLTIGISIAIYLHAQAVIRIAALG